MKQIGVRVMDRDEDYRRMGTKKGIIETWEDGKMGSVTMTAPVFMNGGISI